MRHIVKKFDSLSEYSRYLLQPQSKLFQKYGHSASINGSRSFTGTKSYLDAENLLKFGDKENLAKLQTKMVQQRLSGSGETQRIETFRSFVGYAPHVPSYIAGQPKTMLRKRVVRTTNSKVLNIMYNPTVHCEITVDEKIDASLSVMNFISSIEKQGYKVNLYTIISLKGKQETVSQIVKIKSSDDYTDLAKVVYPMVNPSFLRRHGLRFMEVTDGVTEKEFCRYYGVPMYRQSEVEPIWKQMGIRVDYYFDFYEYRSQLNKVQKQIN